MIVGLTWTACDKSSDPQDSNALIGTWVLIKVSGGLTGGGYVAKFDALRIEETKFDLLNAKSSIYTSTYSLVLSNGIPDTFKITNKLHLVDGFTSHYKKITLDKDSLVLSDPCCDLFTYEFTRSKN